MCADCPADYTSAEADRAGVGGLLRELLLVVRGLNSAQRAGPKPSGLEL